ncbi:transcription factor [Ganoderma sinense ZZ0214-1]|uniref:Transcription factor n=1 Tax=Ganoderma sinense ZZ0214-1 TaxID=1077348 RepID=A0A2G8RV08_9APHY|nr:transcription factor [Ganoderma sinense ZZ0214-1]
MQNNYSHGNYSGQQSWTSGSDNYSWRESVENATTSLDPDVYSDRNSHSRYPVDPNIPIYHSAGPDPTAFQQGLQAAYATGIQPGSQYTHHATQPQYPYATPVDPYAAGFSRSASDPGTGGQGVISPAYYSPHARPLSPASSMQNPNASTMRYAPFPPPPGSPMPLPRNDGTSRQISSAHHGQPLTVDGKQRERVFIACGNCRRRRSKCDGAQPCTNCQRYREECTYDQFPVRRGQDKEQRIRSPAGVRKSRKSGSRRDDDDDDEHEASTSGHY